MEKINPLRTKHNLEVTIDDVVYKFEYKALNKHIQAELDEFKQEQLAVYEKSDELRATLKEAVELKAINDEILKDSTLLDKAKVYFEQKGLVSKIASLEKEIKQLDSKTQDINEVLETYYKKQFDLCVVGSSKLAFQKAIDEAGISYAVINIYINQALKEAVEKK